MAIASCIGCGCTDRRACVGNDGPCYWLVVDYDIGRGVCSCCEQHLDRWNTGERSVLMLVAKITKEDEEEPFYIEKNGMGSFPSLFDVEAGDKFGMEWVEMSEEQFEALPQFEHMRLARQWQVAYDAAEEAEAKGLVEEAQKQTAEAVRLAGEIQKLGFDVLDLVDTDEDLSLGL